MQTHQQQHARVLITGERGVCQEWVLPLVSLFQSLAAAAAAGWLDVKDIIKAFLECKQQRSISTGKGWQEAQVGKHNADYAASSAEQSTAEYACCAA
jgi:hypothetical protein